MAPRIATGQRVKAAGFGIKLGPSWGFGPGLPLGAAALLPP
ncbi:hypothetical protein BDE18_0724 [Paracoccus pantotrophus]|uniref:Uncharacterized protein n=1 Tax=Paracoccus pantotrophus TaxID=82367 RepID=A0ABX9SEX1_PARPN|nr:hypothetical protein BDE18_0724 [Paracoccus pantotrophus]